ncbi:hypothetical protein BJ170DRAFT_299358 [Xylariales sp. AK1849]|nr:hypothetical protein BJ170DRAFT_299358 [Xylariales sp. AK1849]
MASRIPPLLESYLALPPETSLIVLTNVLGASTNWLIQRYLCSLLTKHGRNPGPEGDRHEPTGDEETSVILISFLRDYGFWREGVGRTGIDLDALSRRGRFVFVDALSEVFSRSSGYSSKTANGESKGRRTLRGTAPQDLHKELHESVAELRRQNSGSNIVLIVDSPDLWLAASGDSLAGQALRETLLDVREKVHSTIVALAADEPLVSAQATSLEKGHAALTLSLAHEADMVISLRLLDTGTAKDVSGVLRITRGGSPTGFALDERELLYFVGGDGGVRVFERGQ